MKEIEDDTNKWTDIYICRLEDLIMLTCLYFPKQSANSMQSPIKIPISSSQLQKKNSKMHMEPQKTPIAKANVYKKEQNWRYHILDLKMHYKDKSMVKTDQWDE